MKNLRKPLSMLLAVLLLVSALPPIASGAYSDAYGEQLVQREIPLQEGVDLHSEIYWSNYYSDLRQEFYVTYTPGGGATPMVSFGGYVTNRSTVMSAAQTLESSGYRVLAGFNADFFDSNGTPTGLLISDGALISSDGGNYAVGFKADGSAVIGSPGLSLSGSVNGGSSFSIAGLNKARSSSGGIYAYTYDFNAAHTTGTTEAGIDVVLEPVTAEEVAEILETAALEEMAASLSITVEELSTSQRREALEDLTLPETVNSTPMIGESALYQVVSITERTSGATPVAEGQLVLSVNAKASSTELDILRNMAEGDLFALTITARDEEWNEVVEGVGGLYLLVEDGQAKTNLGTTSAPRTAIGVTADGEVVIYAVDGRRSGYSIGSSLNVLAQRMEELGCETAICFDGGGSTTAVATLPDDSSVSLLNLPSDNSERAVTNALFLVSNEEATGRADQVYLDIENPYVLAGSTVTLRTALLDTGYYPMSEEVELSAEAGTVSGYTFTAPEEGGTVRITASAGRESASLDVEVVDRPDELCLLNGSTEITSLSVQPGGSVDLTASAYYNHLQLTSADTDFTWTVSDGIGTVDENGVFTAAQLSGSGTLTLSKNDVSVTIPVTVTTKALQTLEDFEGDISGYDGYGVTLSQVTGGDYVRYGSSALRIDYALDESGSAVELGLTPASGYNYLTFSVYGDGSGNTLSLYDNSGVTTPLTTLDFTGWKQISLTLPSTCTTISALVISGDTAEGTIYLDQFVASYGSIVDNTAPVIHAALENGILTGTAQDAVDGYLGADRLSLTCDGVDAAFTVDSASGTISADLSTLLSDGKAHRISLTAWDASGNRSRTSWDIEATTEGESPFTDNVNPDGTPHWAASFIEYFYDQGIITGYEENGQFMVKPDNNMTRAEFAVMVFRYLGLDEADYQDLTVPFADLDSIDAWALPAAKAMYALGIMNGNGTSDGKVYFSPKDTITRAQAITMLGRLQEKGYESASIDQFSDSADVPSWALSHVQTMVAQGILTGSDGLLNPNGYMTRAQAAKVLYMMR